MENRRPVGRPRGSKNLADPLTKNPMEIPKRGPRSQCVTVRMTLDLLEAVHAVAKQKNISRTAAVEGLLRRYLAMPLHPFDTKQDHRNVRRLKL